MKEMPQILKYYILWSFVSIHTIYGSDLLNVHKKKNCRMKKKFRNFKVQKMKQLGRIDFKNLLNSPSLLDFFRRFVYPKV